MERKTERKLIQWKSTVNRMPAYSLIIAFFVLMMII